MQAAYIYLSHEKVVRTDPVQLDPMVNIDYDARGQIVGIEILGRLSRLDLELPKNTEKKPDCEIRINGITVKPN